MSQEEVKQLIERYPYLTPRNVWTDKIPEDYDYTYIIGDELPQGWKKLFLQMCEDIRQPLIDSNYINNFRFTQVKEKYNTMRCYVTNAPKDIFQILFKYEVMAKFICTQCGQPATQEIQGYVISLCDECYNKFSRVSGESVEPIEFKTEFTRNGYSGGYCFTETISFENEWNRYIKTLKERS